MRRRAARRRPRRGYRADRAAVWRVLRVLAEDAKRRQEWHRRLIVEDLAVRRQEREEDRALGRKEREEDRALGRKEREEDRAVRNEDLALGRKEREEDRAAREEDRALRRKEREEDLAVRRQEREEDLTLRRKARDEDLAAQRRSREEDLALRRKARNEDLAVQQKARDEDLALRRKARDEDLAAQQEARDEDLALRRKARDEDLVLGRRALDEHLALLRHAGEEFLGTVQEGIREWNANREKGWRKIEKEVHRVIGDGDARWGRLMEALTEGDLPVILRDFGIEVTPPRRRMAATRGGYTREWDLVALGERASVVVEVKTTLRPEDVGLFRTRMEEFRLWMPDFDRNGMSIHGALAYLSADESVLRHAERRGFFLIRVVGSSASIRNPRDFVPAAF